MTALILPWPRHHRARCSCEPDQRCGICDGGLFLCTVCGCAEGELPTDCPGERLHEDERAAIYNGHVDFVSGKGWVGLGEGRG